MNTRSSVGILGIHAGEDVNIENVGSSNIDQRAVNRSRPTH